MASGDDLGTLSGSGEPEDFIQVLQARARLKQSYVSATTVSLHTILIGPDGKDLDRGSSPKLWVRHFI